MHGISDTNAESLKSVNITLHRHQILDTWHAIRRATQEKVLTSEAAISKEVVNDIFSAHGCDAKEYVEEQIACQFNHKLCQDLKVDWKDEGWQFHASARRIILTEDDLFNLMLTAIAEYKASEELTK